MKQFFLSFIILLALFVTPTNTFAANDFQAEYFNNVNLSGTPSITRTETQVNYDWGTGSPDPSIPNDNFSARWTGTFHFEAGNHILTTSTDDGARLTVDNQIVINEWKDQGPTTYNHTIDLSEGDHMIKFEYYEKGGGATAFLSWEKENVATNTGLRIMPLGDSITDGWDIPGGYRVGLKSILSNSNFVGSLQNGPAELNDKDHEGHSGWRIDELQSNIVSWLQTANPEMILLMIGTNDMIGNHDLSNAPQRLSTLIDTITQTSPNAEVLVASITPLSNAEWQQRVNTYNQTIPGIVQQKRDTGKKVHYVDMHTALTLSDLPDGIHPNSAGYTKMAQKWKSAIDSVNNGSTPEIPEEPIVGEGQFVARYFNNMKLEGTPVLTRNENAVNNDWVGGSPHASVNSNFFSADWTTTQTFAPGIYEFSVTGDDGVRLFINNQLTIDQWKDQGPTIYKTTKQLDGEATILLQYYENSGGAVAKLNWQKIGEIGEPTEPEIPSGSVVIPTDNGFKAEYFNNMTVSGTPVLERLENEVNNNWGTGSPHSSINNDSFSARWQGKHTFAPGTYRFTVRSDDGIKLIIGDKTYINYWKDQGPTTYTAEIPLDGEFPVVLEYYEKGGGAVAELGWEQVNITPPEEPVEEPEIIVPAGQYQAEYFNNSNLSGTPVVTRVESFVDYNWVLGSPDPSVQSDNFSARWTLDEQFDAKTYRFTVTADDGVRLKVDGQTVIDKWIDQGPTTYSVDLVMTAGEHTVVMEYYEKGWGAVAKLAIQTITPPVTVPTEDGSFTIDYFNNTTLTGLPVHTAVTSLIYYDWVLGSPHASVNPDNFSARAVKTKNYTGGTYRFTVTADDGVQVKVDGSTIINKWIDQAATTYNYDLSLAEGNHTVTIEYYEKGWGAVFKFNEVKL